MMQPTEFLYHTAHKGTYFDKLPLITYKYCTDKCCNCYYLMSLMFIRNMVLFLGPWPYATPF